MSLPTHDLPRDAPASPDQCEFGPFRLDRAERLLTRGGQPVALTPKAFDLLVYLVDRAGRLAEKRELMAALWPDTVVEEANLAYTVSAVRKALGDSQEGEQYIQTVPTRGYRFVTPVRLAPPDPSSITPPSSPPRPPAIKPPSPQKRGGSGVTGLPGCMVGGNGPSSINSWSETSASSSGMERES